MRIALLSDIHANLEALETAAAYLEKNPVGRIAVLGDTIGYGSNPNECFEWALKNASVLLMGNHEKALLDPALRAWFNPAAAEAVAWTEKKFRPVLLEEIPGLVYSRVEKEMTFAHGSPDSPEEFRYLMNRADAEPSFKAMENRVCFVGHTHVPCCFCENKQEAEILQPGIKQLEKSGRIILNPGSVGQPRDRDPRLSFGVFDSENWTFEIVRLEYDNQKAAEKIRKAGLPAYLADRLL